MTPVRHSLAVACIAILAMPPGLRAEPGRYELKDGKWTAAVVPKEGTAAGEAALIRQHVELGQPRKALKAAKKFLKRYSDDKAREEVLLLAGLASIDRGRLYKAFEWFEQQLSEFPAGQYSAQALEKDYEIAEQFLGGRKRVVAGIFRLPAREEGLSILTRITEHAPGSVLAQKAMLRIADDYYTRGEWPEAVDAYDHYVKSFRRTGEVQFASLRAARAMYASFKGVAYDDTPLIDAQQRFRSFAAAYPAAARKANVSVTLKEIEGLRAEKVFRTARFYERTGRHSAAVFSYRQIVDAYPSTDLAEPARDALVRLGATPAGELPVRHEATPRQIRVEQ